MRKQTIDHNNIFVIHNFLSSTECAELIAYANERGFLDAPITTSAGPLLRRDIRNHERVMVDDVALATRLWEQAQPFLPSPFMGVKAFGFNERLRFYRYHVGHRFAPHFDAPYIRNDNESSVFTFMIYLNDVTEGGETNFYRGKWDAYRHCWPEVISIRPETGKALAFVHEQLHEGAAVSAGCKYVLRTDVMYCCEA